MLFETEKSVLVKLPDYINTPSIAHTRTVDEYGYVRFDGNYYHVPETLSKRSVTVLQYAHHLGIMDGLIEALRHQIAADGVKNERIAEPGHIALPRYAPRNRRLGCEHEEKKLLEMGEVFAHYLDMAKSPPSGVKQRPAFIRGLYALSRQCGPSLLERAVKRAQAYNVFDLGAIERIVGQFVEINNEIPDNPGDFPEEYQQRGAYREGQYSDENPLDYSHIL